MGSIARKLKNLGRNLQGNLKVFEDSREVN